MILNKKNEDLNLVFNVRVEDFDYALYVTSGTGVFWLRRSWSFSSSMSRKKIFLIIIRSKGEMREAKRRRNKLETKMQGEQRQMKQKDQRLGISLRQKNK
ncbi:hypothetical protein CRENBAI_017351 [Crenichthys baileyi]|uniref:Uncharacterized protein n=1 Tax=Crenichthys baileyi TaxID=28760 RepID=A0AAV9SB01_9TELE